MATSSTGKGSHPEAVVTIHLSGPAWGHAVAMLLGPGFVLWHGSTQQCPGILYWGQPPGFRGAGIGTGMLAMHANTAANKRQRSQPLDGLDLSTLFPWGRSRFTSCSGHSARDMQHMQLLGLATCDQRLCRVRPDSSFWGWLMSEVWHAPPTRWCKSSAQRGTTAFDGMRALTAQGPNNPFSAVSRPDS